MTRSLSHSLAKNVGQLIATHIYSSDCMTVRRLVGRFTTIAAKLHTLSHTGGCRPTKEHLAWPIQHHNGSELPQFLSLRLGSLAEGHTDSLKLFAALSICERESNATSAAAFHPQPMVVQPPPSVCTHRHLSASYLLVGFFQMRTFWRDKTPVQEL